jgi:hypothetical protein
MARVTMAQSEATPPSRREEPKPDARGTSRDVVRRIGWLARIKGEQVRECTVWDESDTGMRLVVNWPEEVPDTFYVYTQLDSASRRHCRVVWRNRPGDRCRVPGVARQRTTPARQIPRSP